MIYKYTLFNTIVSVSYAEETVEPIV